MSIEINQIYNEDCLQTMAKMPNNFIDLIVTSPPYYNAREYAQWENLQDYYNDMQNIFEHLFAKLKNHAYMVVNVGDIVSHIEGAKWNTRRIMLGSKFITMLETIGMEIIDDIIWDKGEPQTKRHLGNPPYPYYQKPINCYEHIIIAEKNVIDKTKIECPDCNKKIVSSNSMQKKNVQSWECKNTNCKTKSNANRGKRFSARSVRMNNGKTPENTIDLDLIKKWRRDIVRINPVVKINAKGMNKIGHTAPYPIAIPEMAIKFFSCTNDLIYDPFIGSGTTAVVAKENKRNYIGSEISSNYYEIAVRSLQ
jgi:DNA modification methylase